MAVGSLKINDCELLWGDRKVRASFLACASAIDLIRSSDISCSQASQLWGHQKFNL